MHSESSGKELWIHERFQDFYIHSYRVEKTLMSGQSDFQAVDVVETKGHGKMLLNDGLVMVSERDEFVYHDMIAHVPLFVHPNPKKVLIIGGGDGGTAREVIRHTQVEEVVQVEIDQLVVDACKEHIPQTSDAYKNPKVRLLIDDGVKFVAETSEKFDVVLVDSTDPIGPAKPLFGVDFYKNVYRVLTDNGIVVSQGESPFLAAPIQKSLLKVLKEVFPLTSIYNFSNLTYPGGLWSFTFASKGLHPLNDFKDSRVRDSGLDFQYYNERIHQASFCLPSFMNKNLEGLII